MPDSTLLLSLLFADNMACLASGNDLPELINFINQELNKIAVWFRSNKLVVNSSKTKYIIFYAKNKN